MISIGQQILDEITKQGMVNLAYPDVGGAACVFVWNANTADQLDAVVDARLRGLTRELFDVQDMLSAALNRGDPTILHSTAHAVRDNLRTILATLERPTP